MKTLAVAGAGPAGLMAAGTALQNGLKVTVFDPNGLSLKKLGITGKGRCNLTNDCDLDTFFENIPKNPRFLMSAVSRFTPRNTMEFFTGLGVPLKAERGSRVFPVSDKAAELIQRLVHFGVTRFRALFRGNRSRSEVVATFIAVLELCKAKRIRLAGTDADCTVTCTGEGDDALELSTDAY